MNKLGQKYLFTTIENAIEHCVEHFDISPAEVVGVLHLVTTDLEMKILESNREEENAAESNG